MSEGAHVGEKNHGDSQICRRTHGEDIRCSFLPGHSRGPWITQDTLVAANAVKTTRKFVTFDFKTQKWSDLVAGNFVNWACLAGWQVSLLHDRRRGTQGPAPPIRRPPDRNHHQPERPSSGGGFRGGCNSSRCRARWLPGLHPRHRLPGNLRPHREVAVSCPREPATRKFSCQR